jgi:hypothetical protein
MNFSSTISLLAVSMDPNPDPHSYFWLDPDRGSATLEIATVRRNRQAPYPPTAWCATGGGGGFFILFIFPDCFPSSTVGTKRASSPDPASVGT